MLTIKTINMKYIVSVIVCLVATFSSYGQDLFKGANGKARFFSDALLEDIEAKTNKVTSAYNLATGEVAVLIPIKSFSFDKTLMQEHFNENYLESDKYQDATFKGKVAGLQTLKPGEVQLVNISGNLTIHGVTRPRDIQTSLKLNLDGSLSATGEFELKIEEHKIKVPSLVFQNIAEIVEVSFELLLKKD